MRYLYLTPFRVHYYFPTKYTKDSTFSSFYTPYGKLAKIFWLVWNKVPYFKYLFTASESKIPFAKQIKSFLGEPAVLAFNLGTTGPEQKLTVIGRFENRAENFFIKLAYTEKAKELVKNEISTLSLISNKPYTPNILQTKEDHDYLLLMTSFVSGNKLINTRISDEIMDIIIEISNTQFNENINGLKACFAHGDFCPWNILVDKGKIIIIDWEMGGNYPLGYDLFSFIFQTQFLLNPQKSLINIIQEDEKYIYKYFDAYSVINWSAYLFAFADLKLKTIAKEKKLYSQYLNLKNYAREQA